MSDKSSGRGPSLSLGGNQGGGAAGDRCGGRECARAAKRARVNEREASYARGACACHMQQRCRWHVAVPRENAGRPAEAALCFCVGPTAIPNTALYVVCTVGGEWRARTSCPPADVYQ